MPCTPTHEKIWGYVFGGAKKFFMKEEGDVDFTLAFASLLVVPLFAIVVVAVVGMLLVGSFILPLASCK